MGGPLLGLRFKDWLGIEAGLDGSHFDHRWLSGFGGLRLTRTRWIFSQDVEIGLGGGAGGAACYNFYWHRVDGVMTGDCGEKSEMKWYERPVFGVYSGFGLGIRIWWFSAFVRGRWQYTVASNAPDTMWVSAIGGLQISFLGCFHVHAGAGAGAYWNMEDPPSGSALLEFGVSISFDVLGSGKKGLVVDTSMPSVGIAP